jgi:hypothetical protein
VDEVGLLVNADLSGADQYLRPFTYAALASAIIVVGKTTLENRLPELERDNPLTYFSGSFLTDTAPAFVGDLSKKRGDLAASIIIVNLLAGLIETKQGAAVLAAPARAARAPLPPSGSGGAPAYGKPPLPPPPVVPPAASSELGEAAAASSVNVMPIEDIPREPHIIIPQPFIPQASAQPKSVQVP